MGIEIAVSNWDPAGSLMEILYFHWTDAQEWFNNSLEYWSIYLQRLECNPSIEMKIPPRARNARISFVLSSYGF